MNVVVKRKFEKKSVTSQSYLVSLSIFDFVLIKANLRQVDFKRGVNQLWQQIKRLVVAVMKNEKRLVNLSKIIREIYF